MSAMDHFLNGLDMLLKHGNARKQQDEAGRQAKRKKMHRDAANLGQPKVRSVALSSDPSCCIVPRSKE